MKTGTQETSSSAEEILTPLEPAYAPVFLAIAVVVAIEQHATAQQQLPQLPVVSNANANNAATDASGNLLYRVSAQAQRLDTPEILHAVRVTPGDPLTHVVRLS